MAGFIRQKTAFLPVNYIVLNNLERFPYGLEFTRLLALQFISDLLELPDRILRVQTLAAIQAYFGADTENRGVHSAPEAVFPLLSPPTYRRKPGIVGMVSRRLSPLAPVDPSL
jgi:hypothetical protein